MKVAGRLLSLGCIIMFLAAPAPADWRDGDPHKMHYPQLPKEGGWDVAFNLGRLADDWRCSETGLVEDVHFWISWQQNNVQPVTGFSLRIHSDIPDPDGSGPLYSMPAGDFLYERDFGPGEFTLVMMADDPQGWFDPLTGTSVTQDHRQWAQINVEDMDEYPDVDAFEQTVGEVYWLEIDGFGMPNAGWKQSGSQQFRDDGVYWDSPRWLELTDPHTYESMDLAFVITPEPATLVLLAVAALALMRRRRLR